MTAAWGSRSTIQDEDHRRAGEDFYIAYGSVYDEEFISDADIGGTVCECLAKAGVPFEWNGDPKVRIKVLQQSRPSLANLQQDEGAPGPVLVN